MATLSKKQIKQLRTMAHQINPLMIVGRNGITDAAIAQASETLDHHELVKFTILDGAPMDAKDCAEAFAGQLGAQVVQVIGNRFVLYRRTRLRHIDPIRLVRE